MTKSPLTFHELLKSTIEKYNHNHDPATGRFTSGPGGSSGGGGSKGGSGSSSKTGLAGKTGTGDAASEVAQKRKDEAEGKEVFKAADGTYNSLQAHMDANGNLSPEREALHREIIEKCLAGKTAPDGQPVLRMMGGGPASGKGSVDPIIGTFDDAHHYKVDPDEVKKMLPGYDKMTKETDQAACYYHEESSALAKRIYQEALNRGLNVTYDGTGDGSMNSLTKKLNAAKEKGYRTEGEYVTVNVDVALQRNQSRYEHAIEKGEPARLPPADYVKKCHAKVTDISVEAAPLFDKITVYDNNGPKGSTKKIAEGGSGKGLKAVPGEEQAFNDYLSKGAKGLEGFVTLPDGQVVPVK